MSVRPSVRPSVRNAFVKIAENGVMQDEDASYVVYTALFPSQMLKKQVEANKLASIAKRFSAAASFQQNSILKLCALFRKFLAIS